MDNIYPCLWFANQAEEAAQFYCSVFPNSKIKEVLHYDKASAEASGQPEGSVLTVEFELDGRNFLALNGGPVFNFTEAISICVDCATQAEIDDLWSKLTADGGEEVACGWLKDRYGLSWQIAPTMVRELFNSKDREAAGRAMAAMLKMKKLDIAELQRAFDGKEQAAG